MVIVVAVSGSVASGKTTLSRALVNRWGGRVVSTRDAIRDFATNRGIDLAKRADFQAFGDQLDRETDGKWVADWSERSAVEDERLVIIDAVRIHSQVTELRRLYGRSLVHVHLITTDRRELANRYRRRSSESSLTEFDSYEDLSENPTEANIDRLADHADVVLDTLRNTEDDLLVRCEARLGLLPQLTSQLVDVLVGGQYGSEGKGNIAYYLAPEYDVLVRVGGPNAGHKVKHRGRSYTHRSLPSGALSNPKALLVIGPGAVIRHSVLMEEIALTGVDPKRIRIDPQAMVISDEDVSAELELRKKIQSTGQGAGAAAARRILGRAAEATTLARDSKDLEVFVAPTAELLNAAYSQDQRVLVEGTQGTGLSLFHGQYPYVTSRDTTVAGTLAEAGIGPQRVRRTIIVVRTYPIRVHGASGPIGTGRELSWADIEARSGAEPGSISELSSVTKKQRRVAEFDWSILRRSAELNSATDIALTFADYISASNSLAFRYEQLTSETLQFVEEVESVTGAAVSLITTAFSERNIIDRRSWRKLSS